MLDNYRDSHHVVIIGGGFGGLYAAQALLKAPVRITLIDKRNFHLFQPLLYQIATGGVSPAEIASPLRAVLSRQKNTRVLAAEVVDVRPAERVLRLHDGEELNYDTLIVATGARFHYFGRDEWAKAAPGLKTLEDALELRRRIFLAFETAEREPNLERRRAWLTFVIVGGGPTGVELAGALGELAHRTLRHDFRMIDPTRSKILLVEGTDRILPTYPPRLSTRATLDLERLGVTVQTNTFVTNAEADMVTLRHADETEQIQTRTIMWAAGVNASGMGEILARGTGAELDRIGRVIVEPDLTIRGHPQILVIGDLANFSHQDGEPLPGLAPVAMQQGEYAARLILARCQGNTLPPFRYRDKGQLAVIGRNAAIADFGRLHLTGFLAWLVWVFVHIRYLIEFDNKLIVLFQWAWTYFTRHRGARLITGQHVLPSISSADLSPLFERPP